MISCSRAPKTSGMTTHVDIKRIAKIHTITTNTLRLFIKRGKTMNKIPIAVTAVNIQSKIVHTSAARAPASPPMRAA